MAKSISIRPPHTHTFAVVHMRESPKMNVFCVISKNNLHDPFLFEGNVTGDVVASELPN